MVHPLEDGAGPGLPPGDLLYLRVKLGDAPCEALDLQELQVLGRLCVDYHSLLDEGLRVVEVDVREGHDLVRDQTLLEEYHEHREGQPG